MEPSQEAIEAISVCVAALGMLNPEGRQARPIERELAGKLAYVRLPEQKKCNKKKSKIAPQM